jgi:hypothetical protein
MMTMMVVVVVMMTMMIQFVIINVPNQQLQDQLKT